MVFEGNLNTFEGIFKCLVSKGHAVVSEVLDQLLHRGHGGVHESSGLQIPV